MKLNLNINKWILTEVYVGVGSRDDGRYQRDYQSRGGSRGNFQRTGQGYKGYGGGQRGGSYGGDNEDYQSSFDSGYAGWVDFLLFFIG